MRSRLNYKVGFMRDERLSRILAGLGYFPNMIIAAIPIAYTLITKKGGGYAKFHALQAIVFFIQDL